MSRPGDGLPVIERAAISAYSYLPARSCAAAIRAAQVRATLTRSTDHELGSDRGAVRAGSEVVQPLSSSSPCALASSRFTEFWPDERG
jgi:hypothetical protein